MCRERHCPICEVLHGGHSREAISGRGPAASPIDMTRAYDRPATLAAFVNAVIVYLLPLAMVGAIALFASDYSNGGTRVAGVDPDRAAVWLRRVQFIGAYIMGLAPFAMAAAWRTFVHARRWLARRSRGGQGILEAAACGFAGAVLVLLPGIVTQPTQRRHICSRMAGWRPSWASPLASCSGSARR